MFKLKLFIIKELFMVNTKSIISQTIRKSLTEEKNINKRKSRIINENRFQGKTIINVDIQPEYESFVSFSIEKWVGFINEEYQNNEIIFLYNGEETLGMIDEYSYKDWLLEKGIEEEILDRATFYDKGYAFFRYCMDNSIDEDNIADLVRFMMNNDINDSRDIDKDMWKKFMQETNHDLEEVKDLLENADDMINIPDLMDFLQRYSNIVLTGGGIDECLKEVEIALLALNKSYHTYHEFIY